MNMLPPSYYSGICILTPLVVLFIRFMAYSDGWRYINTLMYQRLP